MEPITRLVVATSERCDFFRLQTLLWFIASYLLLPPSLLTIWFHLDSHPFLRPLRLHNERASYPTLLQKKRKIPNYLLSHKERNQRRIVRDWCWNPVISSRCRDSVFYWQRWWSFPKRQRRFFSPVFHAKSNGSYSIMLLFIRQLIWNQFRSFSSLPVSIVLG